MQLAHDAGLPSPSEALAVKYLANECGHLVGHKAQHVHGGIGVDLTYPIHRYLYWSRSLASQHGGIWVSLGQAPSNAKAATNADLNNLGGSVGLMVRSPSDASVDEIHSGDLASAALRAGLVDRLSKRGAKGQSSAG